MPRKERVKNQTMAEKYAIWLKDHPPERAYMPLDAPVLTWQVDRIFQKYSQSQSKLARRKFRDAVRRTLVSAMQSAAIDYDRQEDREFHLARAKEAENLAQAIADFQARSAKDRDAHRIDYADKDELSADELNYPKMEMDFILKDGLTFKMDLEEFIAARKNIPRGNRADKLSARLREKLTGLFPTYYGLPENSEASIIGELVEAISIDHSFPGEI